MIVNANALNIPLAGKTVQCCVTSPPYYGLRDYGMSGQLGLEPTPEEYVANLVSVFREVWRVMKDDGTLWVNIGDSYAGSCQTGGTNSKETGKREDRMFDVSKSKRNASRWGGGNLPATDGLKPKDLIGIPWMVAFALRADGWYLRSDVIWSKPNPMPESVTDRPTKAHEYLFLLTKSARYYYDNEAIKEPSKDPEDDRGSRSAEDHKRFPTTTVNGIRASGLYPMANKRSVWTINTQPTSYAHFATYPEKLVEPCILAGSRPGNLIFDPFSGSGTTGRVAIRHNRKYIGTELNFKYINEISHKRLTVQPMLTP